MKRSAPTSAPCSSDVDKVDDALLSGWQQWQARFRKSKNVSLLEDHHIDPHVLDHMQLKPSSSTSAASTADSIGEADDDDVFAYLPMMAARRRNSSMDDNSNKNDHHQDEFHYYDNDSGLASASALPFPTLRRDHSSGGGRLSVHNKRQKLSTFSGGV